MKRYKKRYLVFFFICSCFFKSAAAQDSIVQRVIFIGDAGEINYEQETVIPYAANHILSGKTTVIYLGDNIYPRGIGLEGSPEQESTRQILRSQYEPMRAKGAPVYFVPGNHDWDRMAELGLAKIKAQWQFLDSQNDPLLKLVPANGCPDPVEIPISSNMVIIAYDSEWWLFTHDKTNADCNCDNEAEIIEQLDSLFYKNRDKVILLAGHHPFASYGTHGGYYNWKDHLFPLTAINKNLYIPLPVIGSLYPLLRSSIFLNPEDMHHPLYQHMIREVDHVFEGFPNLTYVAGHEHGLQLIKNPQRLQVVSGAGAKHSFAKKGKYSRYADATQGFVTADLLLDKSVKFTFYTYSNKVIKEAYTYTNPYTETLPVSTSITKGDSISIAANPAYNQVSSLHLNLFGEGFRKEWAAQETLPLIRISEIAGGLKPLQRGGGMQSTSLRLADPSEKEWVIRSVNKNPDALLPPELQQIFARDWLDDATSSQHPYSALIVPPLADAVQVPHANPFIGVIVPDPALNVYSHAFEHTLVLLEEREPLGKSDNSIKMIKNLQRDNDNSYDAKEFLRARMLDLLMNDWDRHEDQWRWKNTSKDNNKFYVAIPRDRDQVLRLTKGFFPYLASREWALPALQGFESDLKKPQYTLFKSRFLNAHPASQFSHKEWMIQVIDFTSKITDRVLEDALSKLPEASYKLRHDELLKSFQKRRDQIPEAMDAYYTFINKIVDLHTSDKNELIEVTDAPMHSLRVQVLKINKEGELRDTLMDKVYDSRLTKEIRIYTGEGNDSVLINTKNKAIKIRLIAGNGTKSFHVEESKQKIKLYTKTDHNSFYGKTEQLKKQVSNDSTNTAFVPVNLYNVTVPIITMGFNDDDGVLLGGGFRYIRQEGFRKSPYTSSHQLQGMASFKTGAFRVKYKGEWIQALDKADFTLEAKAFSPNTQNFFGLGNNTLFDHKGPLEKFYHSRFSVYQLDPALRWRFDKQSYIAIGPSLQYYHFSPNENEGRLIMNPSQIGSYDSLTVDKDKLFAGITAAFLKDNRDNKLFPTSGGYIQLRATGYAGLNSDSKNYIQLSPEMAIYQSIGKQSKLVIAERLGGVTTFGKPAFYQSAFLGGHENLRGFRQYRFAGQHVLFNNLEARIKLAQVGSYILPGQFGLIGFYDAGKVWTKENNTSTIHQGYGGGLFYMPAQLTVFQVVAGHSKEGWLPYFTLGFRF
ncbi:Surface antigen (D15) precursor [Arcticibacter svalbardensis MN12-7]|uniref:Surface antigen (D15) n=1 Tax=Arcticibacter svalbardensis MN12-7 TaxID=1150600 RepID=R9GXT4_9SPHI|nr:BamA/TamA family outer membrane protein [Arcticibacter svalbardensis]EOR96483.1 Surface antigen (D15) precursor [Arcticibacter svalbardensis MN12-7]